MKNILLLLLFLISTSLNAQHNNSELPSSINTTGTAPDASALLDVSSTDKGILIPRMTSTQREAINNPAPSLMVYDTDSKSFWYYQGQSWNEIEITGSNTSWNNLTGIPTDIADGDNVDDADHDPSNELQSWSNLPGIPANIDADKTDDFSGSFIDLGNIPTGLIDGDDINDADSDPTNEIELPIGGLAGQILMTDGAGNTSWTSQSSASSSKVMNIPGSAFLPEVLEASSGNYNLEPMGRSGSNPLVYPIQMNVGSYIDSIHVSFNPKGGHATIRFIEKDVQSGMEQTLFQFFNSGLVFTSEPLYINTQLLQNKIYRISYHLETLPAPLGPPVIQAATIFYHK